MFMYQLTVGGGQWTKLVWTVTRGVPVRQIGMRPAHSHRDLKVYRAAFRLQQRIFLLTRRFPSDERFALTSQIRRSSRGVGANIAEGWQKRRYQAHFVSKLTDADAELAETKHWLDTARACGYLEAPERAHLDGQCIQIGALLGSMMRSPARWCKPSSVNVTSTVHRPLSTFAIASTPPPSLYQPATPPP